MYRLSTTRTGFFLFSSNFLLLPLDILYDFPYNSRPQTLMSLELRY